jgi:mevalonate kinase
MQNHFTANGKLLLTGEYVILNGAKSLALPLLLKQKLTVGSGNEGSIVWKAYHPSGLWFSVTLNQQLDIIQTDDLQKADYLASVLKKLCNLQPTFSEKLIGKNISTRLDWQPEWGFGSSSSLISLLAQWSGFPPFDLHRHVSSGSGYDVFCATAKTSLLFSLIDGQAVVSEVIFNPPFSDRIFFVYLGKKQSSDSSVKWYRNNADVSDSIVQEISMLTSEMLTAKTLAEFNRIIVVHETIIGQLLKQTRVKDLLFPDFSGQVKSLGAWGGDFAMVSSEWSEKEIRNYFNTKGFNTIFAWSNIIRV